MAIFIYYIRKMILGIPLPLWIISFITGSIVARLTLPMSNIFAWVALFTAIILKNLTLKTVYLALVG
ncbi:hypothetical protein AR679_gp106 [Yellowstone lake phycodnavirus 1]|uniref:hypothetical protein n=1 Tax=Yellowstone lake phycodnavirus 1 TaxID=1586713 RepID=UPI0006EB947F|nr:hypothetical protein AR679_gp106 [Yellowstone lake phycodnavirus 1]BAT22132.1 hypothetical protein [Yellowstone lake phycodnavirus 1]